METRGDSSLCRSQGNVTIFRTRKLAACDLKEGNCFAHCTRGHESTSYTTIAHRMDTRSLLRSTGYPAITQVIEGMREPYNFIVPKRRWLCSYQRTADHDKYQGNWGNACERRRFRKHFGAAWAPKESPSLSLWELRWKFKNYIPVLLIDMALIGTE